MNARFMSKLSEPLPSDEEAQDYDDRHDASAADGDPARKNGVKESGTKAASHSRKMRLKEMGQIEERKSSGGGTCVSVLAKVSMFEAHNKRVASSVTPNSKVPTGLSSSSTSQGKSNAKLNNKLNFESAVGSRGLTVDVNDERSRHSSSTRNTAYTKQNVSSSGTSPSINSNKDVGQRLDDRGISTFNPEKSRVRIFIPENKLSPEVVTRTPEPSQNTTRHEPRYRPRSQSKSNNADEVTTSSSRIKPEVSSDSVESGSDRRRKMEQAKKIASTTRAMSSPEEHKVSRTTKTSPPSILRRTPGPDPLDREGITKDLSQNKKYDLDDSPVISPSIPASPTRRRKIKMAGDKLKRDRQRDSLDKPDSTAPKMSPMNVTVAKRNKEWEQLDMGSQNAARNGAETSSGSSFYKSERKPTVSPSLLPGPGKEDRILTEDRVDLSPVYDDSPRSRRKSRKSPESTSVQKRRKSKKRLEVQTQPRHEFDLQKISSLNTKEYKKKFSPSTRSHQRESPQNSHPHILDYSSHGQQNLNISPRLITPQTPHFFAPITGEGTPNFSYHDEDDETQFNSVSMQDYDRSKSKDVSNDNATSHKSSLRGVDGLPSYFTGSPTMMLVDDNPQGYPASFGNQSVNHPHSFQNGHGMDDDAESYTDSVTNGSWTGRMRARKKAEQANVNDRRTDPRISKTGSKHSVRDKNDDYVSVSSRVLSNVSKQQKMVVTDAKKGMEEMKNFANEDPKSVAVGLGVVSALCGAIIFGPVGIVICAASVGVGYKVMQMPEEQRSEVKENANSAIKKLQDSAVAANDAFQSSCATACGNPKEDEDDIPTHIGGEPSRPKAVPFGIPESIIATEDTFSPRLETTQRKMPLKVSNLNPNPQDLVPRVITEQKSAPRKMQRITPACRRMGRITPVSQIHSLDPALHPRAWLDVMASAWTSREEKNEAMEEILLLAKGRNHARMLLEEGILDSLMYIIRGFFSHYADIQRKTGQTFVPVETYMADLNFIHAKLASTCCVALGKAHCAVVHTNGEEMISATVHVTVPVAKQVAQLLYEIPHHMAVVTNAEGENKEIFKLTTEMSTHQAEALASSIFSLSMGKVELTLEEI